MAASKLPSEKDVRLLLSFLADSNEGTVDLARRQLKAILVRRPAFGGLLENLADVRTAHEARLLLEETRLEALEHRLRRLAGRDKLDLEEGVCLIASLAYPQLERSRIRQALDQMAEEVGQRLSAAKASPAAAVRLLCRYFFDELGFHGNQDNYYDPDNSYINRVLERRIGIPISLSCVYLLVAWRLDLAAYGVGLPGHFIVSHPIASGMMYLDPFHGGRPLTRADCARLVRQRGLRLEPSHLEPTPNRQILARLMVNLVTIYTEQGLPSRAQWLARLVPVMQGDA